MLGVVARVFHLAQGKKEKKPMLDLSSVCDGCSSLFSMEHALDCRVGGLVIPWNGMKRNGIYFMTLFSGTERSRYTCLLHINYLVAMSILEWLNLGQPPSLNFVHSYSNKACEMITSPKVGATVKLS